MSVAPQKRLSVLNSLEETGKKTGGSRSGVYGGYSNVVILLYAKRSLTKITGVLEHCCEEDNNCWFSIFWGAFPSDRIPKATKDVNVHFFIHSSNSCKL